jgi:hypothetical protein
MSISLEGRKIAKQGDYFFFSIPKAFIDNKLISKEKEYDITLVPSEKNKKKE